MAGHRGIPIFVLIITILQHTCPSTALKPLNIPEKIIGGVIDIVQSHKNKPSSQSSFQQSVNTQQSFVQQGPAYQQSWAGGNHNNAGFQAQIQGQAQYANNYGHYGASGSIAAGAGVSAGNHQGTNYGGTQSSYPNSGAGQYQNFQQPGAYQPYPQNQQQYQNQNQNGQYQNQNQNQQQGNFGQSQNQFQGQTSYPSVQPGTGNFQGSGQYVQSSGNYQNVPSGQHQGVNQNGQYQQVGQVGQTTGQQGNYQGGQTGNYQGSQTGNYHGGQTGNYQGQTGNYQGSQTGNYQGSQTGNYQGSQTGQTVASSGQNNYQGSQSGGSHQGNYQGSQSAGSHQGNYQGSQSTSSTGQGNYHGSQTSSSSSGGHFQGTQTSQSTGHGGQSGSFSSQSSSHQGTPGPTCVCQTWNKPPEKPVLSEEPLADTPIPSSFDNSTMDKIVSVPVSQNRYLPLY